MLQQIYKVTYQKKLQSTTEVRSTEDEMINLKRCNYKKLQDENELLLAKYSKLENKVVSLNHRSIKSNNMAGEITSFLAFQMTQVTMIQRVLSVI